MSRSQVRQKRQDRVGSSLHIDNFNNPHKVSLEQLGLGEIGDINGYTQSEVDTLIANLQALIDALEGAVADLEDTKLDRQFSIHTPSGADPIPSVPEGELNQYTEVRTEGGLKITEHKIRNQFGEDFVVISFSEVI